MCYVAQVVTGKLSNNEKLKKNVKQWKTKKNVKQWKLNFNLQHVLIKYKVI